MLYFVIFLIYEQAKRRNILKTVIMAGGKGTRITSFANNIPKPMIQILGKPVLNMK